MIKLEKYTIFASDIVTDAIKSMNVNGVNLLVVIDSDHKALGVFTIADFRKAVLQGLDINEEVSKVINRNYFSLNKGFTREEAIYLFEKVNDLPVFEDGKLVDVLNKNDFLSIAEAKNLNNKIKNLPVIIMAGGKGKRLDPFTRILPKPLIPLGNDPVIKVIMDEFGKFNISNFYISIRDKGQMIKAYFHDSDLVGDYSIQYVEENKPLGTAGSLKYLEGKIETEFFVSNCDIIVNTDYESVYDFHKKGSYNLTIIAAMRSFTIPYGVCDVINGGDLEKINEKPEYSFVVNTGLYLIEPEVLSFIPENRYFDMTDLIDKIDQGGLKVGVYPVPEKSWIDVGQWAEYKKTIEEWKL